MTAEQCQLVENNLKLVTFIARHYAKSAPFTMAELEDIGNFALVKAAIAYNPERSMFATFASKCIRNEITYAIIVSKRRREVSLDTIVAEDDRGHGTTLSDRIGNTDIGFENTELHDAVNELPEEDKQIIVMRYYQDMTQSKVSKATGVTQGCVAKREARALNALREKLKTI